MLSQHRSSTQPSATCSPAFSLSYRHQNQHKTMRFMLAAIYILLVSTINAMPITENEGTKSTKAAVTQLPTLSVVPLKKSADKSLEKLVEYTKPEIASFNPIPASEEQHEAVPQLTDKKLNETKQENKAEIKVEDDKIKAIESMLEIKPDELLILEPSQKQEHNIGVNAAVVTQNKVQETQESIEPKVAVNEKTILMADTYSAADRIAISGTEINHTTDTKKIIDPTKEIIKSEDKPDRVTRGTEDSTQDVKDVKKNYNKIEDINKSVNELTAATINPAAAISIEEKLDASSIKEIAEEKRPKIETSRISIDSTKPNLAEQKLVETVAVELNNHEVEFKSKHVIETVHIDYKNLSPMENSQVNVEEQRAEENADSFIMPQKINPTQMMSQKEITALVTGESKTFPVTSTEKITKSIEKNEKNEEMVQAQKNKQIKSILMPKRFQVTEGTNSEKLFHKPINFEIIKSKIGVTTAPASTLMNTTNDESSSEEIDNSSEKKPATQFKETKKEVQKERSKDKK